MSIRKTSRRIEGAPKFGETLVQRYASAVRRYFDRRLSRVQDIEDMAQEVYLRLLRIDPSVKVQKPLQFVYGIARHVLIDHRAEATQTQQLVSEVHGAMKENEYASDLLADRPEDQAIVEQQLCAILQALPPLYASILILHDRDGRSYEELAAELGISPHTVKKYLTEARARVRMLSWDY